MKTPWRSYGNYVFDAEGGTVAHCPGGDAERIVAMAEALGKLAASGGHSIRCNYTIPAGVGNWQCSEACPVLIAKGALA